MTYQTAAMWLFIFAGLACFAWVPHEIALYRRENPKQVRR